MRKATVVLLAVVVLTISGCERAGRDARGVFPKQALMVPPSGLVPPPEVRLPEAGGAPAQLSYEHELSLELPSNQLKSAYQGLLETCRRLGAAVCVNLKSSLGSDELPMAELRFKVRRDRVDVLRQQASMAGEIVKQDTTAEDLAGAIVDVKRRLAMKIALRDDLLALRSRSRDNIDALLKVTEKLNEVQSEIEAATADQAGLQDRLDMDRLAVKLQSHFSPRSSASKLAEALNSFGSNVLDGVAGLISFVAVALPWLALLLALPLLFRLMRLVWRWTRAVA